MSLLEITANFVKTKIDRRNFLFKTALASTALSLGPLDFLVHPHSAYAYICSCRSPNCSCGDLCCDGYTEFCCQIYGDNFCPQGTIVGGWWLAEGNGTLCNGPRYYIDCNATCNGCGCGYDGICSGSCSGTVCGCAFSDCNSRQTGCVQFRYGQCNQDIACVGPIVCRVVTCIPPWEIDPTCQTTVLVDEYTYFQDATCLHQPFGQISSSSVAGYEASVSGYAIDMDYNGPIEVQVTVNGTVVASALANEPYLDGQPLHNGHGFNINFTLDPNQNEVCVIGLGAGLVPTNASIGCITLEGGNPFGSFDFVTLSPGGIFLSGWAIDPDTNNPINVSISENGQQLGTLAADQPRPDVEAIWPNFGLNHGFAGSLTLAPGQYDVCANAINVDFGNKNTLLGCKTITVPSVPFGNVDSVLEINGSVIVTGWAIDPLTGSPITVQIFVNQDSYSMTSDLSRNDVASIYPSFGPNHGFNIQVPVPPTRFLLTISAIGSLGNTVLLSNYYGGSF